MICRRYLTLLEWEANGEEPFDSHRNNAVDATSEGYVDDGKDVGSDVGKNPYVVLLGDGGQ